MTYNEVTIDQFQRLHKVYKLHEGNNFEIGMNIINIFEGKPINDIKKWTVKRLDKELLNYKFLGDLPSDNWIKEFEFKGKKYKVLQTPEKWNVGQYISIHSLTKDKEAIIDNIHIILASMVSSEGIADIQELAEEFRTGLSIALAYPIALFFCAVMLTLQADMKAYSQAGEYLTGLA